MVGSGDRDGPRRPLSGVKVSVEEHDGLEFVLLDVPAPSGRAEILAALTAAEREVAELVLGGCTNAEVASRRGTSARTVANQLARIYRTLEVGSRTELCALLSERNSVTLDERPSWLDDA